MSTLLRTSLMDKLGELRHEPTAKRIRAVVAGGTVVDSTAALLVWEPRRVVPSYAVPVADVRGVVVPVAPAGQAAADAGVPLPDFSRRPVLDPSVPFAAHTAPGTVADVRAGGVTRAAAGLLLDDPDLAGYVVLDFAAFDEWYEEDDRNIAHPRDPFKRIDVLDSSRHVRVSIDGQLLAESGRPRILYETLLPPRYYLPREDVRVELLPSPTRSLCAYKGQASYWSPALGGGPVVDLAWSYARPLEDAVRVRGMVAFFDERVDVEVDGELRERPVTPWTPRAP
ncbi:MAG: hypothetical protein QOJ68_3941 [Blastococcus sp.]|nr:hypothetical protein [Blastococcus sp.]